MLINAIVNDLEAKEFINNTKPSQSILFQTTLTGKL